jgi:dTDP-4-dehydrorhamnose 3,5-epimerase
MEALATGIDGCYELRFVARPDRRGRFLKVFQSSALTEIDAGFEVRELFFTWSARDVLRGLHFQLPPSDVAKLVFCLEGTVLDAVLDVRVGSPTFGEHRTVTLSAEAANAVLVPLGCAHGFVVRSDGALVGYAQSGELDPACDSGVLWSSAGIAWGVEAPTLSERDAALVPLAEFVSPFRPARPAGG